MITSGFRSESPITIAQLEKKMLEKGLEIYREMQDECEPGSDADIALKLRAHELRLDLVAVNRFLEGCEV